MATVAPGTCQGWLNWLWSLPPIQVAGRRPAQSSNELVDELGDDSRPISCGHRWLLLLLEHGKGIGMYRIAYECEWSCWILLDPVR